MSHVILVLLAAMLGGALGWFLHEPARAAQAAPGYRVEICQVLRVKGYNRTWVLVADSSLPFKAGDVVEIREAKP